MSAPVHSLEIAHPSLGGINRKEALRYAGCPNTAEPEVNALLDQCIEELEPRIRGVVVSRRVSVDREGDVLRIGTIETDSAKLKKNLTGCGSAIVFAATVGMEIDRMIRKYTRVAPSKALMLQALGAERAEALCDAFEREIAPELRTEGLSLRPRFSPGYGDFPIERQRDFFRMLKCEKTIGVTLNESLLMSPSKSVTALIGLAPGEDGCRPSAAQSCRDCGKAGCAHRV